MTTDGLVPLILVLAVWHQANRSTRAAAFSVAGAAIVASLIAVPLTAFEWTRVQYSDELVGKFSRWREIIPHGTEVLWPTAPLATWILLARPDYISAEQSASALFSRSAAIELNSRTHRLAEFINSDVPPMPATRVQESGPILRPPPPTLATICASAPVKFVITEQQLDKDPIDTLPIAEPQAFSGLKLYSCAVPKKAELVPKE